MGTSTSYGGPGDTAALLPAWARPEAEPAVAPEGDPDAPPEDQSAAPPEAEPAQSPAPMAPAGPANDVGRPWQAAKGRSSRHARGSGGGLSGCGRSYVRARGGARQAARSAAAGRAATRQLGGFLSTWASRGLAEALRTSGLALVVGQTTQTVVAAIVDAIAPAGATLEAAIARMAVLDSVAALYERLDAGALPDRLDREQVTRALRDAVVAYVYERWLQDLGRSLATGARTPAQAERLEREIKEYVTDLVVLDLEIGRASCRERV